MSDGLTSKVCTAWPPQQWQEVTVLIAVSGGADSVALVRALHALKTAGPGRLMMAHYNHRWRGEEAVHDEHFVRQLADQLQLNCHIGRAAQAVDPSDQAEAAARQQRYLFLEATANQVGARFVTTAHTADDQAETILHRILRGTSLAGLAGIPRLRQLSSTVTLVRPLLGVSRQEVLGFLRVLNQSHCHDATNQDTAITRNRIRHELLPLLSAEYNPRVADALRRLGAMATDAQRLLDERTAPLIAESCRRREPDQILLTRLPLQRAALPVLRQTLVRLWAENQWPLQAMTFDKWNELAKACQDDELAKFDLPGGVRVIVGVGEVKLERTR